MNDKLTDDQVAEYLIDHPDFFIQHARQVETMRVPHPVRGSVSLIEWQLARQRKKIQQLEEEITQLMESAVANELLFNRLMLLQNELISAGSLQELIERLNQWAKSLGLASASIRLFSDKWHLTAPSGFTHLALTQSKFELLRVQRFANRNQYLGTLNGPEILTLMPTEFYVGSVALTLLGQFGDLGVLIFNSRDNKHYYTGQGTLLLDQLRQLLPVLINRWIQRK